MLRSVTLPPEVPGKLYLRRMPGYRGGTVDEAIAEAVRSEVDLVVSLASPEEIRAKSPDYAAAIESDSLPWTLRSFPIPDFGAPADRDAFLVLARDVGAALESGKNVLIHCAFGVGRTGTLATCVLMAMGQDAESARAAVHRARSGAESDDQVALLDAIARADAGG